MNNPNLHIDTGHSPYSTNSNMNSDTNTNTNTKASPSSSSNSLAQKITNLDFQNNIPSEFRVYTTHGAFLSLTTIILLLYLFSTEYTYNLSPTTREKVKVDTSEHPRIEMEIDITFPNIACPLLSFDAVDPNNQRQSLHLDNQHRVWKHRIGKDGKWIGKRSKFENGKTLQNEKHVEEYAFKKNLVFTNDRAMEEDAMQDTDDNEDKLCGSCYGASPEGECCNTCDDVKRAYQIRGWQFAPNLDVKQCRAEKNANEMTGEGCNVHGMVSISSGGGHVHVTPGHELENFGKTFAFKDMFDLVSQAFETFNVTHTVHKLRFGQDYPGDVHQLDGEKRMVDDEYAMYQYYFQIVPTEYKFLNGTSILSNQYSVIEHMRHVEAGTDRGLPGVYFYYEVSPLHVMIEEYRHGWIRFFTSVAAVVGGVFSAMKMTDAYVFSRSSTNRGMLSPY